jgi:hypothetical protein
MFKSRKECKNCQVAQLCRDSAVSWVFLVIGLVATVSIRVVNLVLPFGIFWPKFFWYLGVGGFFLYFFYKFREDRKLRLKLEEYQIHDKLLLVQPLGTAEKEFLRVMLCRMRSHKDAINYFFIFTSSAIVLFLALYQDFIKKIWS